MYPKARTLVAGIVNSKHPEKSIIKDMEIVFYEFIYPNTMTFLQQFEMLSTLGFNTASYKLYTTVIESQLPKILLESNVNILDKNINSYEIAFASNCAITYGSTMGYELNAHNKKTLFIDPGFRCTFLPEKGSEYIDNLRLDTYAKFNFMIKDIIENKKINNLFKDSYQNLCLESSNVSNRIFNYFENQKKCN
jgi:hypothetical protein